MFKLIATSLLATLLLAGCGGAYQMPAPPIMSGTVGEAAAMPSEPGRLALHSPI